MALDLLSDVDVHQFIERGMRGGISMVTERYAKANNRYMPDHEPSKPTSFLQYLDANNLYGWAMCQHLPISEFAWREPSPQLMNSILSLSEDAHTGYMIECDLAVPPSCHDLLNDYPVALEKMRVQQEMLSPYQHRLADELQVRKQGIHAALRIIICVRY